MVRVIDLKKDTLYNAKLYRKIELYNTTIHLYGQGTIDFINFVNHEEAIECFEEFLKDM